MMRFLSLRDPTTPAWIVIAAGLMLLRGAFAWGATPTRGEATRWAQQLSSPRYEVRQLAQRRLLSAGEVAIDALEDQFEGQEVEGTRLALEVLRQLAVARDKTISDRALTVIEDLAENRVTATSFRAATTLKSVREMRSPLGIKYLRRLGARFRVVQESYEETSLEEAVGGPLIFVFFGESWRGEPEDLFLLSWLSGYRGCKTTFDGVQFDNRTLATLAKIPNVVGIHLKRTSVTDDGLASLAALKRLTNVVLQQSPVTEACLVHLDRKPSLNLFYVFGCKISRKAFEDFKTKHKDCETRYARGGFLGIGGRSYQSEDGKIVGCQVRTVTEGHAAHKAGIRQHDIITHYDGQAVTQFIPLDRRFRALPGSPQNPAPKGTSLAELIGHNAVGDRIQLKLLRGKDELTVEVELGEWP